MGTSQIQAMAEAIPPPPFLAFKILKIARQEPVDFGAITRLVVTDAALSSALIKRANASRFGVRRPIVDVARALITLGRDLVIDLVMLEAMRSLKTASRVTWPGGDDLFWKHSVGVAITARYLAAKLGMPHPEEAFTCGLLHDFGKLVMLNHSEDAYRSVLTQALKSGQPLHKVENLLLGLDHAVVAGAVCRQWHMPDSLIYAIEAHHKKPDVVFGTLGNLVRSANLLVKVASIGNTGSPFVRADAFARMPHTRLAGSAMEEMLVGLPAKVNELAAYILGSSGDGDEEPLACPLPRELVLVDIAQGEERLLVKYILMSLGFETNALASEDAQEAGQYAYVVTDNTPLYSAHPRRIDYHAWRSEQRPDSENYLDGEALRAWLVGELAPAKPIDAA